MILLRLFFEFAKVGLFAVGGGLATIPFLQDMGTRTGWFTDVAADHHDRRVRVHPRSHGCQHGHLCGL